MAYPDTRKFSDAVLNPGACFNDPELADGQVALHPRMRTPLSWPGKFASVYKVTAADGQNFAVRCFKSEVRDHQSRYYHLSQYLRSASPPGFVEFDYQPRGIRVGGEWYPIVKMEWVNGQRLDEYIDDQSINRGAMQRIAAQWRETATDLQTRDIAHNDLQHGNVMVLPDGAIKLVDYDGSFLPQLQGNGSLELGHRNFQHPERTSRDYDAHIDNFPALVIYLSLLAVAADPDLWERYNNGENLIFTESDFAKPQGSILLQSLKGNGDANISKLAVLLESCCARPVAETPTLEKALQSNGATPRKTSTSPYLQLIQERQSASEHSENQPPQEPSRNITSKIDRNDIFEFCRSLDGQTLTTVGGTSFVLKYSAPNGFIIRQGANSKTLGKPDLNKFLDQFEEIQSWNGRDYRKIEGTATFCLAILLKYIARRLANILETSTALAVLKTELHTAQQQAADANKRFQTEQSARRKAESDKDEANKQLKVEQAARLKAEQAVRRQNEPSRAEANKQFQMERAARLKAESDKAEANKQLRIEQFARRKAESERDKAAQKLQEAQGKLQTTPDATENKGDTPKNKSRSPLRWRLKRRK